MGEKSRKHQAGTQDLPGDNYEWLVQDSPSLVLMLDESLLCQGIAGIWRARLAPRSAQKTAIPAAELFDFESAPELIEQFKTVARDGVPIVDAPAGLLMADGILPCRFGAWRAQDINHKHPCIMVAATDVSTYQDKAAAMDDLQTMHGLILGAAGEGIYGISEEGLATFVNPAAVEMTGWTEADLLGRPIHDLHHHTRVDGSPYPREECPIYAAAKDGRVHYVDDEVFWRKDGSSFPVEYTSTPIYRDHQLAGAVVVFKDITKRKNTERELHEAYAEVERMKEQLEAENIYLQEEINVELDFAGLVGQSPAIQQVLNQVDLVAPTDASVLITGESGTGKELIARAIHERSDRHERPLIRVNCAAIPKELFESEFFGHVKGAYTGAIKDRVGRFELADGGTIFLDEVGEIPLELQSKLLRVLQEGQIERVGEEKTRNINVRVIAATNRDLKADAEAKLFREDLYFRLNVFPVEVVPLRERSSDIPLLAAHFVALICKRYNRDQPRLTQANVKQLQAYHWPGNVRELQNIIERAVIVGTSGKLEFDLPGKASLPVRENIEVETDPGAVQPFNEQERLDRDRSNIIAALKMTGGKVSGKEGAAELLGIKPTTLASRMASLGIQKSSTNV